MRTRLVLLATTMLLGAVVGGCGSFTDPSQNTTDTLSGVLQPKSSDTKTFTASKTGEVTVKLTTLMPPFANFLTVVYSQQISGACSLALSRNDFVLVGSLVVSGRIDAGTYCLTIADQGNMTVAENYTFTVTHP